jgi:cytosine/adenosine deaminase-related metal-dependent hydrolase
MRRGAWHQFGDRSQRLAEEQLRKGAGIGVIISERDLSRRNAAEYAQVYHQLGAHVLIDQQFYNPQFTNPHLQTYPINKYRAAISQLKQLTDQELRATNKNA